MKNRINDGLKQGSVGLAEMQSLIMLTLLFSFFLFLFCCVLTVSVSIIVLLFQICYRVYT